MVKESIGNSIGKVANWLLMRSRCLTQGACSSTVTTWRGGMGWRWERGSGGRDMCILRADLHCCMAEVNTIF